jgi:hypothetical protein
MIFNIIKRSFVQEIQYTMGFLTIWENIIFSIILLKIRRPAAQIEISAAQTRIENQLFFNILGIFPQFFVFCIMWPQKSRFQINYPCCGPKTDLGWPSLLKIVLSFDLFDLFYDHQIHSNTGKIKNFEEKILWSNRNFWPIVKIFKLVKTFGPIFSHFG